MCWNGALVFFLSNALWICSICQIYYRYPKKGHIFLFILLILLFCYFQLIIVPHRHWLDFSCMNSLQTTTLVPLISSNAATIAVFPKDGSVMEQMTVGTVRMSLTPRAQVCVCVCVRVTAFHAALRFCVVWVRESHLSIICHLSALVVRAHWRIS